MDDIWFNNIVDPCSFEQDSFTSIANYVASKVLLSSNSSLKLSTAIDEDSSPRIVFISLSDGVHSAKVMLGKGKGIKQAIENALNTKPLLSWQPSCVKVDIVDQVVKLDNVGSKKPINIEPSLMGLAFNEYQIALLPEQLSSYGVVSNKKLLRLDRLKRYYHFQPVKQVSLYQFTTHSFFVDDKQCSQLYRGHKAQHELTPSNLLNAAVAAGNYLISAVEPSGQFVYSYLPKRGEKAAKYNILRHAGTIYSMLELFHVTKNPDLMTAAKRAMAYLLQPPHVDIHQQQDFAVVVDEGNIKLGGNALVIIMLAKYIEVTDDKQYLPLMQQLARWIKRSQNRTGCFTIHKQSMKDGSVFKFISEYYPGEAILSLLRLYRIDKDTQWLDMADKASCYLINIRDGKLKDRQLSHDHWLLYALNELYRLRRNELFLKHAFKIAGTIMKFQNKTSQYPDWHGSYYDPPRSTPAATRMEGLSAAYQLAKDFDDQKQAVKILEAIKKGIHFQMHMQYHQENSMYLSQPMKVVGGFRRSYEIYEVRIDYVQHNISSFLSFKKILSNM